MRARRERASMSPRAWHSFARNVASLLSLNFSICAAPRATARSSDSEASVTSAASRIVSQRARFPATRATSDSAPDSALARPFHARQDSPRPSPLDPPAWKTSHSVRVLQARGARGARVSREARWAPGRYSIFNEAVASTPEMIPRAKR